MQAQTKRCSSCGEDKPLEAFSRSKTRHRHGRQSRCKDCTREYQRKWRADPVNRARNAAAQRKSKRKHPEKHRARMRVVYALGIGDLVRPKTCERCGTAGRIDAHHADYSKPLEVEWLCRPCHRAEHHPDVESSASSSPAVEGRERDA